MEPTDEAGWTEAMVEALRPGRWFAGIQAIGPAPVVYEVSVRFTRPFIEEIFDRVEPHILPQIPMS